MVGNIYVDYLEPDFEFSQIPFDIFDLDTRDMRYVYI
jgi:hypothetical protein